MKQPGKRVKLLLGLETSYGVNPTLATTHAMRHVTASIDYGKYNRVDSPEKKAGPGKFALFDRRGTAAGSVEGLIRPSGTINTLPECSAVLEGGFGSKTNVALATTVDTTTAVGGATLASVTGLVAGGGVLITCPDGKKRLRVILSVNSGAKSITWAPNLPSGQAPVDTAAVKSCLVYKLTAANAVSLFMARFGFQADFTAGQGELLNGWLIDKLSLMFDYQDEPRFTASGPAQIKTDGPTDPGASVQVGTNPPSAITGEAYIGANQIKYLKIGVDIANGMEARNDQIGSAYPAEGYRMGDRDIALALNMHGENTYKTFIYDIAMAETLTPVFKQTGFTEGKTIGLYAPSVEFKPPTLNVPDGAIEWPFKGRCREGVEDANDELTLLIG